MQSFMLSNSGEVAIPITLKGKIQTIFDNLKGANGADLYEKVTLPNLRHLINRIKLPD